MHRFVYCRRAIWATEVLAASLCSQLPAVAADFEFVSELRSTVTGAELCLAVDRTKPLVPERGAQVVPPVPGAKPLPIAGTFYPIVVVRCDKRGADFPTKWSLSDTRELRISVDGKPMCLSARFMTSFAPLLDPFLKAFRAFDEGSAFAYLAADLKPGGNPNDTRMRATPDLVASPCGRTDATDFWAYDHLTGTISGPAGHDDKSTRARSCIALHGDPSARPPRYDAGMPITVASCPDLRAFERAGPADRRWRITGGIEGLPTYSAAQPGDYFSGAGGLPIVGPMGRCLTADKPLAGVVTSDCDGRVEQDWKINDDVVQLGPKGDCLTHAPGGAVMLSPCIHAANQLWAYAVRDSVPNPKWRNADVFAQIHPKADTARCLVVSDDPFVDPIRQRNRVKVAACSTVLPRQTSWFRQEAVRTIRIALLRNGNGDGSNAALGAMTDEAAKRMMEDFASHLSEHYHVMGVRFVFDPDHDYLHVKDTIANRQAHRGKDEAPTDWEPENHNVRIASTAFYGKATVVVTANFQAGGFSSGGFIDYDLAKSLDPISGNPSYNKRHLAAGIPKDVAGLLAFSYYVGESGIGVSVGDMSHHAHEFGHYFGLAHTFSPDEFADTPDDVGSGSDYYPLGSITCGNPRTIKSPQKTVTPDRNNNEGYWGCMVGRTLNSFSPMQLGKANWVLQNQLNRYPLVACQPIGNYDADRLECENTRSLDLCRQTADYLKRKNGTTMECRPGGRFGRAIGMALQYPAVLYLLQHTPSGRSLINKLAGLAPGNAPPPPASFDAVADALKGSANLAVTMAVLARVKDFRNLATQRYPALAKAGFVANGSGLTDADRQAVSSLAGSVISRDFIANVPSVLAQSRAAAE